MDFKRFVANRRFEDCDVYVGRPSKWGNPFSHLPETLAKFRAATRDEAIEKYREWIRARPDLIEEARRVLRGQRLGCWCKPARCHAEVLAEIANTDGPVRAHSEELRMTQYELFS